MAMALHGELLGGGWGERGEGGGGGWGEVGGGRARADALGDQSDVDD